jgi:tetratricopeptide (TPR) repeat protein
MKKKMKQSLLFMMRTFWAFVALGAMHISVEAQIAGVRPGKGESRNESAAAESAQNPKSAAGTSADMYKKVYEMAVKYADMATAVNAAYYILAQNPDDVAWKDTLAGLYFSMQAFPQALQLSSEVLAKQPDNRRMLELQAIAFQAVGDAKSSLEMYEKLHKLTRSLYHLYQIAVLQYGLKRVGECEASLDQIIAAPEAANETINITSGSNARPLRRDVKLKAAALNVKGVLFKDKGDKANAKKLFEEALKIEPEFELAKNNMEELDKDEKK